jgi:hypothetical protein
MNPDLGRILNALYERDHCAPSDWQKRDATVNRLISDVLSRQPQSSHEQIMRALAGRYRQSCRARRKYPTLPPTATACNLKPSASMTLRMVSKPGLRSPESAL